MQKRDVNNESAAKMSNLTLGNLDIVGLQFLPDLLLTFVLQKQ